MSTQHEIIRAWCASCGMPAPSNGDCIALVAALTPSAPVAAMAALRELEAAASEAVKAKTPGQEQVALMNLVEPTSKARTLIQKAIP